eukprot:SAG22_NODE_13091_length_419_cov_0.959375_1_plen_90_part_01
MGRGRGLQEHPNLAAATMRFAPSLAAVVLFLSLFSPAAPTEASLNLNRTADDSDAVRERIEEAVLAAQTAETPAAQASAVRAAAKTILQA